jgi:hypothetical protein
MNQESFIYAVYHSENEDPSNILSNINCIDEYKIVISINATACRGKDPIDDKRTRVKVKITEDSTFKQLDDSLDDRFTDIWFEH